MNDPYLPTVLLFMLLNPVFCLDVVGVALCQPSVTRLSLRTVSGGCYAQKSL